MMYRPQFAFKSPADCEEQRCVYSFDFTNIPWLATNLAAGANIQRIPLLLDKDADFYLRGISTMPLPSPGPQFQGDGLEFRLEDPKGHALSDTENRIEESNYQYPELYSEMDGAGIVTLDNCDDYGVYCQAGSRLYLYLLNNSTAAIALNVFVLNLHGIKRYSGERCAA
jgi:hypothetical protein